MISELTETREEAWRAKQVSDQKCPSREELFAYVVGRLPDETLARVAGHTRSCPGCQADLVTIDDTGDTLISRLRRPVAEDPYEHESHCQEAVARVKAMAHGPVSAAPTDKGKDSRPLGQLGEYQLLEKLGEGGMGTVYKAFHTKLGRLVALKVLRKGRLEDRQTVARFEREMKAVGALDHPNVVRAHDARELQGTSFLVMELVDGLDLSKLVARCGRLRVADACELVRQAALGLQAAHEHGLVHRDVKPSNLILSAGAQVKVLDLGLARFAAAPSAGKETTASDQAMGTADYVAPEQIRNSHTADVRADVYSLGCTLYKLLTGRPPFSSPDYASDFDKMTAHVQSAVRPIQELCTEAPKELAAVIDRMLAKDPSQRFPAPAAVADALAPLCTGSDLPGLLAQAERMAASSAKKQKASPGTDPLASSALVGTPAGRRSRPQPPPLPGRTRWKPLAVAVSVLIFALGSVLAFRVMTRPRNSSLTKNLVKAEDAMIRLRLADGREMALRIPAGNEAPIPNEAEAIADAGTREWKDSEGRHLADAAFVGLRNERIVLLRRADGTDVTVPFQKLSLEDQRSIVHAIWPVRTRGPMARPDAATVEISQQPRKLTPDGGLSLTALVARPASIDGVHAWTVETVGHRGRVYSAEFRPDGSLLATACEDGMLRLWDLETGKLLRVLVGHNDAVQCLTWSPDGQCLASGGKDGTIRLWDVRSGSLLRTLDGHGGGVSSIGWSPDGRLLASGGADFRVRVWDVASDMTLLRSWPNCGLVTWSPDGKRLACVAGLQVKLWEVGSQEVRDFARHTLAAIDDLAWSPDGRYLAASAWIKDARKNTLNFWDAETGQLVAEITQGGWWQRRLAWSPNGRILLAAVGSVLHTILAHDLTTGGFSRPWGVARSADLPVAERVAFSPNGATFAVTFSDGTVEVCDSQTYRPLLKLPGRFGAWLPDRPLVGPAGQIITGSPTRREQEKLGALVTLPQGQDVVIGPGGHYAGPPGVERQLVYVVQTTQGRQETLAPEAFRNKYAWKNDPMQADAPSPAGTR